MSAQITSLVMPKWGMSMSEGLLACWLKQAGDAVGEGDELLEIETDKITNVLEASVAGVLRRQVVAEGETVPVGTLLGLIADDDVGEEALDAFAAEFEVTARAAQDGAAAIAPAFVDAGGVQIRYLALGEASHAMPLVLLHGFGGDLDNWLFNMPAWAEERRVLAVELPGHGGSDKSVENGDLAELGAAAAAAIAALDLQRPHLAGHSLGAAVALWLASEGGLAASSLSLLAPACIGGAVDAAYVADFLAITRARKLKGILGQLFADADLVTADLVENVIRYKRLDGVAAALEKIAVRCLGDHMTAHLAPALTGLAVPCQVIWGADDRIIPAATLAALPGDISHHLLDGAGHMVHMEQAVAVTSLVAEFARRHDPA